MTLLRIDYNKRYIVYGGLGMQFDNICSVFGHSTLFDDKNLLKEKVRREFLNLIVNHNVKKFLFGGFGDFDYLCYEVASEI